METLRRVSEMQRWAEQARLAGKRVALVPTMGYLHEGHLSLVREARRRGDVTVVSIFVNPIQFNQRQDLTAYPRDFERDRRLLEELGVDVLFCPDEGEMYPEGFQTAVSVERLTEPLCGGFRPGHFRGVTTVVAKLFNIVKPHVAVFGEKDYQQCAVVKRMARDLSFDLDVVGMPTVREADGLAMSSRNARLSPHERRESLCVFRALEAARGMVKAGERGAEPVLRRVREIITAEKSARLEYASVCDPDTLEEVSRISGPTLLAVGVWIGDVRLIDNARLIP